MIKSGNFIISIFRDDKKCDFYHLILFFNVLKEKEKIAGTGSPDYFLKSAYFLLFSSYFEKQEECDNSKSSQCAESDMNA